MCGLMRVFVACRLMPLMPMSCSAKANNSDLVPRLPTVLPPTVDMQLDAVKARRSAAMELLGKF